MEVKELSEGTSEIPDAASGCTSVKQNLDDRYYLGDKEISLKSEEKREDLRFRLRQYLDVRNVSLLIGNGASLSLGSPSIRSVRSLLNELKAPEYALKCAESQALACDLLDTLIPTQSADIGVETLLGVLEHLKADLECLRDVPSFMARGKPISINSVQSLESLLKKWLYLKCTALSVRANSENLIGHTELLRRFLLRPPTLPRLKVFTTNYDLMLELSLDSLGVHYFDGFTGTINRSLRSESYNYDLYFPGETTEGRVSRVDRVLQLYKMHGSVNWRRMHDGSQLDVIIAQATPTEAEFGELMVYPSPLKTTEMHGYPYSEMFRRFASSIHQPQSVLFAIGYSFGDDHINRIIYQALSIPSFSLIIVLPEFTTPPDPAKDLRDSEVWRLIHKVKSNRIVVITGGKWDENQRRFDGGAGTLSGFSTEVMPDIHELDIASKVRDEMKRVCQPDGNGEC